MDTEASMQTTNTLYAQQDLTDVQRQRTRRWIAAAVPCAVLLGVLIYSVTIRLQWLSIAATIAIGVVLIAGYDLAIKPLSCYIRHVENALHGRTREAVLPFVALSEEVSLVDGVYYHAMTCEDVDGKGRPYDRLFYFDVMKPFPALRPGERVRVIHHDLEVADLQKA